MEPIVRNLINALLHEFKDMKSGDRKEVFEALTEDYCGLCGDDDTIKHPCYCQADD